MLLGRVASILSFLAFPENHTSKIHCHNQSPGLKTRQPQNESQILGQFPVSFEIAVGLFTDKIIKNGREEENCPLALPKMRPRIRQPLRLSRLRPIHRGGISGEKNPAAIALFNRLVQIAKQISPFTLAPTKTQVSFRIHSNFIMVACVGKNIAGYLFLPRAVPAPFVQRITQASTVRHVHHFKISDPSQLEGSFKDLLAEAIAMVTDTAQTAASSQCDLAIGEEINALYRADRNASKPTRASAL